MAKTSKEVQARRLKRKSKYGTRKYNRCELCGRSRAYMRRFGLCRLCFRKLAHEGKVPGVGKSSW